MSAIILHCLETIRNISMDKKTFSCGTSSIEAPAAAVLHPKDITQVSVTCLYMCVYKKTQPGPLIPLDRDVFMNNAGWAFDPINCVRVTLTLKSVHTPYLTELIRKKKIQNCSCELWLAQILAHMHFVPCSYFTIEGVRQHTGFWIHLSPRSQYSVSQLRGLVESECQADCQPISSPLPCKHSASPAAGLRGQR